MEMHSEYPINQCTVHVQILSNPWHLKERIMKEIYRDVLSMAQRMVTSLKVFPLYNLAIENFAT